MTDLSASQFSASTQAKCRTRLGGTAALVWREDIAVPRPSADEVLVRVLAAGVNMADVNTRNGWYGGEGRAAGWAGNMAFPRSQGSDLCGRIVALGQGVEWLQIGARVVCSTHQPDLLAEHSIAFASVGADFDGSLAQYCLVKARHLTEVMPNPLTEIDINAMPCAFGTAHNLLSRAQVAVGERVLVTGASGGVGLAAVQLALLRGAEVTGQCSLSKSAPLRAMNAGVLARDSEPRAKSFDVVIDAVGGNGWQDLLEALRAGGRYATSGAVAGPMVKGDLRRIYLNDLAIMGSTHQPREVFAGLVTVINTARIRPVVSKSYAHRDMTQAQSDLTAGRYPGKLVLIPSETMP